MIEVTLGGERLVAGRDENLLVRLTNTGPGPCTNIVVKLSFPHPILVLHGRDRIEVEELGAGESVVHPLRLRPVSAGRHRVTSTNFAYSDGWGRSRRETGFDRILVVEPAPRAEPEPSVEVTLTVSELPRGEWNALTGVVRNTSAVPITDVDVTLSGPAAAGADQPRRSLGTLAPDGAAGFAVPVCPLATGHVPGHVTVDFAGAGGSRRHERTFTLQVTTARVGGPPDQRPFPSDTVIVVLTALELEHRAMAAHLGPTETLRLPQGDIFDVGTLSGTEQRVALGLAHGNINAAVVTDRAIATFGPRALLFVGIAGALSGHLKLGDVVVGTRVVAYSGGREDPDGFKAAPQAWQASYPLLQLARQVARRPSWQTAVHFGPIAAGDVVLNASPSALRRLLDRHVTDAIAIEMESAGFAATGNMGGRPGLTIRGVSDPADGTKYEADAAGSQLVAAERAARFAAELCAESWRAGAGPDRSGRG